MTSNGVWAEMEIICRLIRFHQIYIDIDFVLVCIGIGNMYWFWKFINIYKRSKLFSIFNFTNKMITEKTLR